MDNIILNCFVARFASFVRKLYSTSVLAKFFSHVKRLFLRSRSNRIWCGFLSARSTIVYSKLYKNSSKFNLFLSKIGSSVGAICDKSGIFKVCKSFAASSFVEKSFVLRSIKSLGMRGVLLVAFAMYLPLDYFIRDVLKIASLGAIWDEALMLFSVFYIVWRMAVSRREQVKPRITPVDAPLIFFISISLLIMAMVSPVLSVAIAGYRAVCQFMLWFFVITRLIEDDRDLKIFYYSICIMAVCIGLHGIYQYIVAAPMPASWVAAAETTGMRTRVYSLTGSPNIMGALMVMTAPMLAALAYYVKPMWLKCLMWAATGVLCLSLLATFSRGAWFGLAIAVVLFCLIVDLRLLFVAAAGVLALIFFVPQIGDRIGFLFTSDFVEANNKGGRGERWTIGFELLESNPVWGFGLGRFGGAIAMQNQAIEGLDYFYMDNYYLKTLVEMGYVGLVSYVYLLVSNAYSTLKGLFRTRKCGLSLLSAGMFSGMVGVLAHSFFENIFEVPYMNSYFWGMAAAIMYISFLRRKK